MNQQWMKRFGLFLIALLLGLAACEGASGLRVSWMETSRPGSVQVTYNSFTGREAETIRADAGDPIIVDYEATVEKGTLQMRLEGPNETELWSETFQADADGQITRQAPQDGRYRLIVHGEETRGGYELIWGIER
jgi:hypothetical protein